MKAYPGILGLLGAGMFAMAGCSSPDTADPGYFLITPGGPSSLVSPVEFMTGGGCAPLERRGIIGATTSRRMGFFRAGIRPYR